MSSVLREVERDEARAEEIGRSLDERADASNNAEPHRTEGVVTLSARELIGREFPPREDYFGDWITSQSLTMIHAWRGIGKTFFALESAYAIASGGRYLTRPTGTRR